jgi:hypothetical protein
VQERRLAAAGGADDTKELMVADVEMTPPIARVVPCSVTNSLVIPLTTTFISITTHICFLALLEITSELRD